MRLFGASLRLTPPGLARKSAPDGFFVCAPTFLVRGGT